MTVCVCVRERESAFFFLCACALVCACLPHLRLCVLAGEAKGSRMSNRAVTLALIKKKKGEKKKNPHSCAQDIS